MKLGEYRAACELLEELRPWMRHGVRINSLCVALTLALGEATIEDDSSATRDSGAPPTDPGRLVAREGQTP